MPTDPTEAYAGQDAALSVVLAEYLDAVDRGEVPDRGAFLAAHPDLADRIRTFFAGQDHLDSLTAPLRPEAAPPRALGAYDLTEEIGRGGMGMVWRSRDRILNRDLAVKILLERYRDRPDLVRRFVEEAQITGQLQHPYIVPVHELGMLPDGRPFFAMKLVNGRTFDDLLAERPSPDHDRERFLHIFEQVCQTIAYAHSKGVIHRDLKPANVMVGAFGEVQVMDWGLAKVLGDTPAGYHTPVDQVAAESPIETIRGAKEDSNTQTGVVLGTLAFMPPEQATGNVQRIDRRSDVFGLGGILCNVLTGQPPYVGEPAEVHEQVRAGATTQAIARLDICGADLDLISLAKRCLAREPVDRPADAAAAVNALATYFTAVRERLRLAEIARAQAETEAVEQRKHAVLAEAKAVAEEKRARAENRRRRATLVMAASLLLLITAAAGFGMWIQDQHAKRDAEIAARRADTERDVTAALREVKLLQEEGVKQADDPERWRQTLTIAHSAFKRAADALNLGEANNALREEVAAVWATLAEDDRDCKLLADLDRVMDDYMNNSQGNLIARAARAYEQVFREYGLQLLERPVEELAKRLTAHRLRGRIHEAVENWAFFMALRVDGGEPALNSKQTAIVYLPKCDWEKADRLLMVLDATEPDPHSFRRRWRAARSQGNAAILTKLAETPDALVVGPLGIVNLANDLRAAGELGAEISLVRKGLDKYPDQYLLYAGLGNALQSSEVGSPAESVQFLTAAAALRSRSPNSHIGLSMAFEKVGDVPAALREARLAVDLDRHSAGAWQWLGNLLLLRGPTTESIECLQKAVAIDETSDKSHASLGSALVHGGKATAGVKHLLRAIELAPGYGNHHFNLASAWQDLGETKKAIESCRNALVCTAVDAQARIRLASLLLTIDDICGAIRELEIGIKEMPSNPDIYYALAEIHAMRGDMAKALDCIRIPVEKDPQSAYAYMKLSEFQMQRDAFGALHAARKAFEIEQQPDTYITLMRALLKAGFRPEAKQCGNDAIKRYPKDAALHDMFGTVLYWRCELSEAINRHKRAIELAPGKHVYHENLGLALRAAGEFEKAESAFRATTDLRNDRSSAHQLHADILLDLDRCDEAIAAAKKAIESNRRCVPAYLTLVQAYAEKGDFDAAKKALERVLKIPPPGSPHMNAVRDLMTLLDDFEQARKNLPAVLAGAKKPVTAFENLRYGIVCGKQHRKEYSLMAVRFLQAAFVMDPRSEEGAFLRPRFVAAVCAVAAATGNSLDAALLNDAQRAELRRQALKWLQADLRLLKRSTTENPNNRVPQHWMIRQWQRHADFSGVRDEAELLAIPEEERTEWIAFFDDVAAMRKKLAE